MEFSLLSSFLILCTSQVSFTLPFYKEVKSIAYPSPEKSKLSWEDLKEKYPSPVYFEESQVESDIDEPPDSLKNMQSLYGHADIHQKYYYSSRIEREIPIQNLNKRAGEDSKLYNFKNSLQRDEEIWPYSVSRESNFKENEMPVNSGTLDVSNEACKSCQLKSYNPVYGQDKNMLIWCSLLECQRRERLMRLKELIDSQRQALKGKLNELIKDNSKFKIDNDISPAYDDEEYYGEEDDPYSNYYLYEDKQLFPDIDEGHSMIPSDGLTDDPSSSKEVLYVENTYSSFIDPSESIRDTSAEDYRYYDGSTLKSHHQLETSFYSNPSQTEFPTKSSEEDYNFYDDVQYVNLTETAQFSPNNNNISSNNSSKSIIVSPNTAEEDSNFYDDFEFTNMNVKGNTLSNRSNGNEMNPKQNFQSLLQEKKITSHSRQKTKPELLERVTNHPFRPSLTTIYPLRTPESASAEVTDSYLSLLTTKSPIQYVTEKMETEKGITFYAKMYTTLHDKEGSEMGIEPTKYWFSTTTRLSSTPLPFNLGVTFNEHMDKVTPIKSDKSRKMFKHFKDSAEANKKRTISSDENLQGEHFKRYPTTSSNTNVNQFDGKITSGEILTKHIKIKVPKDEKVVEGSYLGATNKKLSDISNENGESLPSSKMFKENIFHSNLLLGNEIENNSKGKDTFAGKIHYDKIDEEGKVVKYCLCQCTTERSPTNLNFSELDNVDDKFRDNLDIHAHRDEPSEIFTSIASPSKGRFKNFEGSNGSRFSNQYSTFHPDNNFFLTADKVKELPYNNDRNMMDVNVNDKSHVDNILETKLPLNSKTDDMPHFISETISPETDCVKYLNTEEGYEHLIPMKFDSLIEYMDKPSLSSERVHSDTHYDEIKKNDMMPGLISKSETNLEKEYDYRNQIFLKSDSGIYLENNLKEIGPEKVITSLPQSELMPLIIDETGKSSPRLYHSSEGITVIKPPKVSNPVEKKNTLYYKPIEDQNMKKYVHGDLEMSKEQSKKMLIGKNQHLGSSNLNLNIKKPFIEDSIVSQSKYFLDGEDSNHKNKRLPDSHTVLREETNPSGKIDYKFPYHYYTDQFHPMLSKEYIDENKLHGSEIIKSLSQVSISPASILESKPHGQDNLVSDLTSCNIDRKFNESKLIKMIDSLQKIKKNYMGEGDIVPSASSCDEACKQYVKDKLRALVSIISWLEKSMK